MDPTETRNSSPALYRSLDGSRTGSSDGYGGIPRYEMSAANFTLLCMLPLYLLFEFSILLARAFGTPGEEVTDEAGLDGPEAPAGGVN